MCISIRHFRKVVPLIKKTGVHIKIEKKCGVPFILNKYRKRKMFPVGIFFCIMVMVVLNQFIWDIQILGNVTITDDTIRKYLLENNLYYGVYKRNINCDSLEADLRAEFDEIIWTSVEKKGTRIKIYIQESLLPDKENTHKDDTAQSIYSTKDGVVTSIITRSGTPKVEVGSEVSSGSILVDGKIEITGDDESVVQTYLCRADADIYLETDYDYSDEFALRHMVKEYKDKEKNKYYIKFFSKEFNLFLGNKSKQNVEKFTSMKQLKLWGDFYLPVYIGKITEKEYESYSTIYDKDVAKAIANEHLQQFCDELTRNGIQILEKNVKITIDDNKCFSSGKIHVIEKNGEGKDINWEEQQ